MQPAAAITVAAAAAVFIIIDFAVDIARLIILDNVFLPGTFAIITRKLEMK